MWYPECTYVCNVSFPTIDLAEYVLNKCITQAEPRRQISIDGEEDVDTTGSFLNNNPTLTADQSVHYNFDYLEESGRQSPLKFHENHIEQFPHIDEEDFIGNTTVTAEDDSNKQMPKEYHDNQTNEPESEWQLVTDGQDYVDGPTATAVQPDHNNLDDSKEEMPQEHTDCHINEPEPKRQIGTADAPVVTAEQPNQRNSESKKRQIFNKDQGTHILDWMVSKDIVTVYGGSVFYTFIQFWSLNLI